MKWELTEPQCGDMIRIKTGNIYHYGVYVSDSEVIQFGVAPNARAGLKDSEIEVLATDIDVFLNGEYLEVCVLDKKELKTRIPPKKTVELARSRIGERGYNILYNNCEHFANECVMGVRRCSQADDVREFFRNLPIVDVYVGAIPEKVKILSVYPKERAKEIKNCSSERVKTEKYCAWRMLEYAMHRSFGVKLKDIKLTKEESGKWTSSLNHFSISHTDGVVVVCVSRAPVGVDVEGYSDRLVNVIPKMLTENELLEYEALTDDKKASFLCEKWTQKESIFKSLNQNAFIPSKIEAKEYKTYVKEICENGKTYTVSVATPTPERVRLFQNIDYLK